MSTYETALRDCLLDCKSILELYRSGRYRYEYDGQVKTLLRDIDLLRNREDCPAYDYRKEVDGDGSGRTDAKAAFNEAQMTLALDYRINEALKAAQAMPMTNEREFIEKHEAMHAIYDRLYKMTGLSEADEFVASKPVLIAIDDTDGGGYRLTFSNGGTLTFSGDCMEAAIMDIGSIE